MEDAPLMTVIKQENPITSDASSSAKTVINITLFKPNIFESTNSVYRKKIVQRSVEAKNHQEKKFNPVFDRVAVNRKNVYQESSNPSSSDQCLNANQCSLQKPYHSGSTLNSFDKKVSVKLEQMDIEPELFKDSREKSLVCKVDVNKISEVVDKSKGHEHIKANHSAQNLDKNKCCKCKKSFTCRSNLLQHLKRCGQSMDRIRLLKRFTCEHCDYKSLFKSDLSKHTQAKHLPRDPNANKCSKCKTSFSTRSGLFRHLKICGQSKDQIRSLCRYTCDHCNYKTVRKDTLAIHIQLKHLPRDPNANKCSKCNKTFSRESNLLTHLKICGQSKDQIRSLCRYTCDHCNYRSIKKCNLAAHIQAKHLPRESNANKCNKCNKSFSFRSNLLAHSKFCGQPEEFKRSLMFFCDHCNHKTILKTDLTRHIQAKHLPRDSNANKCSKCKKSFSRRSSLLAHSKICGRSKRRYDH